MKDSTLIKVFGQAGSGIKKALLSKVTARAGGWAIKFFLCFGLARSVIFGGYAPFGISAVSAAGGGIGGLFGLMGALLGYITIPDEVDGLRYAAASVLVFAVSFIFRDTPIYKRQFFMPLAATITCASIGIVFVAEGGYMPNDIALYITETTLVAGTSYFYRVALGRSFYVKDVGAPRETKRLVSTLVTVATLLIPFSRVVFLGEVSLGRLAATVFVLLCGYYGGASGGAISGISAGLAMDISHGSPLFAMIYGFAGLVSGLVSGAGRLWSAIGYVVAGALSVLWLTDEALRLPIVVETFMASVIFMVLPSGVGPRIRLLFTQGSRETPVQAEKVREHAKSRLEQISSAFRDIYEALVFKGENRISEESDMSVVFDRTAERVCRRCALAGVCWDRESYETYNALNDMAASIFEKGKIELQDFPSYFSSRCISIGKFQSAANEELKAALLRRQYKNRLADSRKVAGMQYHELAGVISDMAQGLEVNMNFNAEAEQRIERYLKLRDIDAGVSAYRKANGRVTVEIAGLDLSALLRQQDELRTEVGEALGFPVDRPEQIRGAFGERLVFNEAEPLGAIIGVAALKKEGQKVSGDSGTYFKTEEGRLYIILSDGMGSGREAAIESNMVVRLLERFLRAGLEPIPAIRTLNSAMMLKDDEECGFATADLLSVDLFSGETVIYKCGAAPSYIKRGGKLSRVAGKAVPAGLGMSPEIHIDSTRIKLAEGDYVVITSDGICEEEGESWLGDIVKDFEDESPKELASRIMEEAICKRERKDDMTVLVLRIEKRSAKKASA